MPDGGLDSDDIRCDARIRAALTQAGWRCERVDDGADRYLVIAVREKWVGSGHGVITARHAASAAASAQCFRSAGSRGLAAVIGLPVPR
jgi:hypothetical protein